MTTVVLACGLKKILIVDDEQLIGWSLMKLFDLYDYEAFYANQPEEAKRLMERESFDLVLTDYKMPSGSGMDLLAEIKQQHPRTKVVMMTAFPSELSREKALLAGADEFITKPFDLEDVFQTAERVIRN